MSKLVAISIGDLKGIGIKILIDLWMKKKILNFILFTDIDKFKYYFEYRKISKNINIVNNKNIISEFNFIENKINIYSYKSKSFEDNTLKSLKIGHFFCKEKLCIGLVTLPLRKDLIKKNIDKYFIGQTEFFQRLEKKNNSNMILYHNKIIVSPITTHIKVRNISKKISNKGFLFNQIYNLSKSLERDFNINKPKLVISGINPHAGENGYIGDEEIKIIRPVLNKLKKKKIIIDGPLSADSILLDRNIKKYDCFIFIYHDQALIPFKLISKFSGVNYTGNLNIIRTSPDHGTAYDLIQSKNISNKSLLNSYKLIKKIFKNRLRYDTS